MQIHAITLFPEMFAAVTQFGVTGRAFKRNFCELTLWNPRNYTCDHHHTVDDRPYGGGPGMVMLAQPLEDAVSAVKKNLSGHHHLKVPTILLSPQGAALTHKKVIELSRLEAVILVCGRYEGVDKRFIDRCIDEEISVGDFVVSGGELPAMMLIDSIIRQRPGVLGNKESAQTDSFVDGLLDHPHYTRPFNYKGSMVPSILLSGNHDAINRWRTQKAWELTLSRRSDLIDEWKKTNSDK